MKKDNRGRPSKYDPKYIDLANKYVQEMEGKPEELPTVEKFARQYVKVNKTTIYEWINNNEHETIPLFSNSIKAILELQEERLQEKGLTSKWNPTMAIFLLKANHGKSETQKIDITSKDEKIGGFVVVKNE